MPVASGVFGKADLTTGALTKIWYNSSTNASSCNIIFCNRNDKNSSVRVAIIPSINSGVKAEDYIVYDQPLPVGAVFECTGLVVGSQETIYCYSATDKVSVRVHGFVDDRGPAVTDIGMATANNAGLTVYARGMDVTSSDKAATPALVKALIDAYSNLGGGSGSGSGSGGGFGTKITNVLTSQLAAGTEVVVPSYIVGLNKICVYVNGILCSGGIDKNLDAYQEVGNEGSFSSIIKFYDNYDAGTEITVIA